MKKLAQISIFSLLLFAKSAAAQNPQTGYEGAVAVKPQYKALYFLNDSDPKKIGATLRNINNALDDSRLKGKLEVELVAFGDGFTVYQKSSPYEAQLRALQQKGVILVQCSNTLKERNINKDTLFPFINFVPSGNGEIIIRSAEDWAIIHP